MVRLTSLRLPLALLTLAVGSGLANAQSGPSGPAPLGGGVVPPHPGFSQGLSPEILMNHLRSKGYAVNSNNHPNGAVTVTTEIYRDGWKFVVEFGYTPDRKFFDVLSPLTSPGNLTSDQLVSLLKWHYNNPGKMSHFSFRDSDRPLCFEKP